MRALRSPFWLALPIALLSLGGCGPSKVGQCTELVATINRGIDALEQGEKQLANDPSGTVELRAMADAMEKAAAEVAALELDTPELRELSTRYQAMAKDVAKAARDVAAASDEKDKVKGAAAQAELTKAVRLEDGIIEGLNTYCTH